MRPGPETKQTAKPDTPRGEVGSASTALPVVDVRKLLDGQREAMLVLDGEPYRLRITAKDKLILTK